MKLTDEHYFNLFAIINEKNTIRVRCSGIPTAMRVSEHSVGGVKFELGGGGGETRGV